MKSRPKLKLNPQRVRHIPWKILAIPELNYSEKYLLAIICYANDKNNFHITNTQLSLLLQHKGTKDKTRYVQLLLSRLEKAGWIKLDYPSHNSRQIFITDKTSSLVDHDSLYGENDQLYLNKTICNLNLSVTKRIVLAIRVGFKIMTVPNIGKRIHMSQTQTYQHLDESEQLGVLKMKEINPTLAGGNKPGIEGGINPEHGNIYIGDNTTTSLLSTYTLSKDKVSYDNKEETPVESRTERLRKRLRKEHNMSLKLKSKKTPAIPVSRCPEIDEHWNKLPYLRSHSRPETKVYKEAKKWIKILERGELFKHVDVKALLERMREYKLDAALVRRLLRTKFPFEERLAIYKKLNALKSPGARRSKRIPIDLPTLIYNPVNNMSWFIYCCLAPVEDALDESQLDERTLELVNIVDDLTGNKYSRKAIYDAVEDIYACWLEVVVEDFPHHAIGDISDRGGIYNLYFRFLENKYPDFTYTPGWFRATSKPFTRFLRELYREYRPSRAERF